MNSTSILTALKIRNLTRSRGSFYHRSLIIVLLITSIPILLISIFSYLISTSQIESEVNKRYEYQVKQLFDRLGKDLLQLEIMASRWTFQPAFNEAVRHVDLAYYFETTRDISQSLLVMNGNHPLVGRVALYMKDRRALIASNEGIMPVSVQEAIKYESLLADPRRLLWSYETGNGPDRFANAYLFHRLPAASENPYGAFIIQLNTDGLKQRIDELLIDGQGAVILLNEHDSRLTIGSDRRKKDDSLEKELQAQLADWDGSPGSFILRWQEENYAVTIGTIPKIGWKYAAATPVSQIIAPVVWISRIMLAMSVLGLSVAVLLSLFASNRIYRPVKHLVQTLLNEKSMVSAVSSQNELDFFEKQWKYVVGQIENLKLRWEDNLPVIRKGFLLQLFQGHLSTLSEEDLQIRMEQYNWRTKGGLYTPLVVQLAGFSQVKDSSVGDNEISITVTAAESLEKLIKSKKSDFEVVNFQDSTLGILCLFSKDDHQEGVHNRAYPIAHEIIQLLTSYFGLQVNIVIGRTIGSVHEISRSFEDARQALRFRDLQKHSQIFHINELIPQGDHSIPYPFAIEKNILQAIRMGMEEEANRHLDEFVAQLESEVKKAWLIQQGMMQLLASILHVIMQAGFPFNGPDREANWFSEFNQLQDTEEMKAWFKQKIVRPYIRQLTETHHLRMKKKVEQIIIDLQANYRREVSLDAYADQHGINAFTLSKAFKQVTGTHFTDYLTDLRLDRSKELLVGSELSVSEVAAEVGYQASYFNRVFKRKIGMTPGQFRYVNTRTD